MNTKLLNIVVIVLIAISSTFAQDDANANATATEDTNATLVEIPKLGPSPDALTSYVFPESASRQFIIGQDITFVLGFTNKGNSVFNVTSVSASLMYPQDHKYFIQNYTKTTYDLLVESSEERSFAYKVTPDPLLDAREYGLVVSVFYTDAEEGNFTNVIFNSTIALLESDESIDVTMLFTYVGLLGVVGLVGFVVFKAGRNFAKKGSSRRLEYGTQKATVVDNEWLEGTAAAVRSPKSPRSPKKPKKS